VAGGCVAQRPRACLRAGVSFDAGHVVGHLLRACVRLEAALDFRCRQREDVVEWSWCRSDSAVLKGAVASCGGRLADVSGP